MKKATIVVFAAALLFLSPTVRVAVPAAADPPVASLEGEGLLARLACGACLGSRAVIAVVSYEAIWQLTVGDACWDACAAAS